MHTSPDCRWARRFQWISRSLSRECRRAAFTRMRDSHVGHSPSLYFSFLYFIHATPSALSSSLARVNAPMKFNTAGLVRAPNFLNNEKDCISPFHFYYPIIKVWNLFAQSETERLHEEKWDIRFQSFFLFFFLYRNDGLFVLHRKRIYNIRIKRYRVFQERSQIIRKSALHDEIPSIDVSMLIG